MSAASPSANTTTRHGVFLVVTKLGVLLTGNAGIGKSELALDLISRGHQLVADDAPEFSSTDHCRIIGRCPPLLQDFIEIRGLGIINVRKLFGDAAISANHTLDLIIELTTTAPSLDMSAQRLSGHAGTQQVCGQAVPTLTLNVSAGRSLAVLVEAAVRNHILKRNGYNSAVDFQARLQQLLKTGCRGDEK